MISITEVAIIQQKVTYFSYALSAYTLEWRHNGAIAFQITSLTIVYSTVYSGADQRKHQSSASLAFVRGIHWGPVNSPHKWPVTRKLFPFDDVIMIENSVSSDVYDAMVQWSIWVTVLHIACQLSCCTMYKIIACMCIVKDLYYDAANCLQNGFPASRQTNYLTVWSIE